VSISGVRLILVSAPSPEVARGLVEPLVEEGRVACGTLVPGALSVYRWKGAVERAPECLVLLKTVAAAVPGVIQRIRELHPYEVPEVLVLPVEGGLPAYLDWVAASVPVEGGGR
jgi:periplasmic divalent cation tolerance protein